MLCLFFFLGFYWLLMSSSCVNKQTKIPPSRPNVRNSTYPYHKIPFKMRKNDLCSSRHVPVLTPLPLSPCLSPPPLRPRGSPTATAPRRATPPGSTPPLSLYHTLQSTIILQLSKETHTHHYLITFFFNYYSFKFLLFFSLLCHSPSYSFSHFLSLSPAARRSI